MVVGSPSRLVCWGAASLGSETSPSAGAAFPHRGYFSSAGGLIVTPPRDVRVPSPGPSRRRRITVFPLCGLDGTLGPSPSPGSAPFSPGPPAASASGSGWEPGGRIELTAGPPSLAVSRQPSGASLLFVVSSGHTPNAMLGRGTWESVFVHWKVTSPARDAAGARGCARAPLLLVFICRWLFLWGFWFWFQTSVVPSKMFPLIEPYIGTSAARRVVRSEEKTQIPEKTMLGRRGGEDA